MANRALIFDFDGLICDTEWPTFVVWRDLYARFGAELTLDTWLLAVGSVNGLDPRSHLESLIGRSLDWGPLDRETAREITNEVAKLTPLPGVLELMQEGRAGGWKVGVASNSSTDWVLGGLDRLGLLPRIDVVRTREDVAQPKPAPDVYLAVLAALGADADVSLAFEDSAPGVASAKAAGLYVTAVPNALTRHHDLSLADQCVASLMHALPMLRVEA